MMAPPKGSIVKFLDGEVYLSCGNNHYVVIHGNGPHTDGEMFNINSKEWGDYEIIIGDLFGVLSYQIDWKQLGAKK